MNVENKEKPKQKLNREERKKNRKQWLITLLIAFSIVFLVAQVLMLYFATPILRFAIQKKIKKDTKGLYDISFDRISINLGTGDFILEGLSLKPDTVLYNNMINNNSAKKALYEIQFKKFLIKRINVLKLYRTKKLEVASIILDEPVVKLIGIPKKAKNDTKNQKYDAIHKDLYPTISKYITALSIDDIKIINGHFDLRKKTTAKTHASIADNFSINLYDFYLDYNRFKNNNRVFYSENFDFTLNKYSMELNDSIHTLKAEKVVISTKDSLISVKNAAFIPNQISFKERLKKKKPFFKVEIPEIKISKIDFNKVFFDKAVAIQNVDLLQPHLKLFTYKQKNKQKKKIKVNYADLYPLIKGKLKYFSIKNFNLNKAKLDIIPLPEEKNAQLSLNDINIKLENFLLDSLSINRNKKILYSDDIEIQIKNYQMDIAKNTHVLKANNLIISTKQKKIIAANFSLKPNIKNLDKIIKSKKLALDITMPLLEITGIDFKKAYNKKYLPIKNFILKNPILNIKKYGKTQKKQNNKKVDFLAIASPFLKILRIKNFQIKDGEFYMKNYTKGKIAGSSSGGINFSLQKFIFDTRASILNPRQGFNAEEMDIKFENYKMKFPDKIHTLKARSLNISTLKSELYLEGVSLKPDIAILNNIDTLKVLKKNTIFDIYLPYLHITNTDIHKAYFDKKLNIKNINLEHPKVHLITYAGYKKKKVVRKDTLKQKKDIQKLLSNFFDYININEVNIKDSHLKLTTLDSLGQKKLTLENYLSLNLINFNLRLDTIYEDSRPLYSDDIDIRLDHYTIQLPDKVHLVQIGKLGLSTQKSQIFLEDIWLVSQDEKADSIKKPNLMNFYLPSIKMSGININKLLKNKILDIDEIKIIKPALAFIKQQKFSGKPRYPRDFKPKIKVPKGLKSILVKNIIVEKADLALISRKEQDNPYLTGRVDLKIKNLRLDSTFVGENGQYPMNIESLQAKIKNFNLKLRDSIYALKMRNIDLSTHRKEIYIDNLTVKNRRNEPKDEILRKVGRATMLDIEIPEILIKNIDFTSIYKDRIFNAKTLTLSDPNIQMDNYPHLKRRGVKAKVPNVYKPVKQFFYSFNIGELNFHGGKYTLRTHKNIFPQIVRFNDISGFAQNFEVDSLTGSSPKKVIYSDEVKVTTRNFSWGLKDSLTLIKVAKINLSVADNKVIADSFSLSPQCGKYEFAEHFGFIKTRLDLSTKRMVINDINFPEFFNKQHIVARSLWVEDAKLESFLNQKLPEDTAAVPPRLHDLILNFKPYFQLDTVFISNWNIIHEQHPKNSQTTVGFDIRNVDLNITNICNIDEKLSQDNLTKAELSGKILGNTDFNMNFDIYLGSNNGRFSFDGKIDKMELTQLNEFSEKISEIGIKSGRLKRLKFSVDANDKEAMGRMKMRYRNLNINFLEEEENGEKDKRNFLSFLANVFIRNNNPKWGVFMRTGEIYYKRKPKSSFLNYIVGSLMSGMLSTAAYDTKQMKTQRKKREEEEKQIKKEENIRQKWQEKRKEIDRKKLKELEKKRSKIKK